jgi:hypothetical protein
LRFVTEFAFGFESESESESESVSVSVSVSESESVSVSESESESESPAAGLLPLGTCVGSAHELDQGCDDVVETLAHACFETR